MLKIIVLWGLKIKSTWWKRGKVKNKEWALSQGPKSNNEECLRKRRGWWVGSRLYISPSLPPLPQHVSLFANAILTSLFVIPFKNRLRWWRKEWKDAIKWFTQYGLSQNQIAKLRQSAPREILSKKSHWSIFSKNYPLTSYGFWKSRAPRRSLYCSAVRGGRSMRPLRYNQSSARRRVLLFKYP